MQAMEFLNTRIPHRNWDQIKTLFQPAVDECCRIRKGLSYTSLDQLYLLGHVPTPKSIFECIKFRARFLLLCWKEWQIIKKIDSVLYPSSKNRWSKDRLLVHFFEKKEQRGCDRTIKMQGGGGGKNSYLEQVLKQFYEWIIFNVWMLIDWSGV